MATKVKEFSIKENVFKTETLFIFGTQEQFLEILNKRKIKPTHKLDKYCVGTVVECQGKFFRIVWVERQGKSLDAIGVLIHELMHLVVRICADKGVPIKANIETGECGDETAAYLLEYYYKECLKRL